jgi:hypothetical protein
MSVYEINPGACCVECRHCYISMGSRGYSELTPGTEFDMWCEGGIWTFERYGTEDHYRECMLAARNCQKFARRTP